MLRRSGNFSGSNLSGYCTKFNRNALIIDQHPDFDLIKIPALRPSPHVDYHYLNFINQYIPAASLLISLAKLFRMMGYLVFFLNGNLVPCMAFLQFNASFNPAPGSVIQNGRFSICRLTNG
jgi:hypothetical protein